MKTSKLTTTLTIASVVLLIGAGLAFAHGGGGYGGYGRMGRSYGGHMMDNPGYGPHMRGYGSWGNLSDEDAAKLEEARSRFYKATQELRGKIEEKSVVLRNEMIKDNPDASKVMKLQKELSALEAEFDQKAVQHRLEMNKLAPEGFQGEGAQRNFGRGPGRGYCRW